MSVVPKTALVLSGGGARGAYAVGIVQAIVEVLGLSPSDTSPFDIYSGTSVGSINSTYLAANAQRGDLGVYRLREVWSTLGVNEHLQMKNDSSTLRGITGGWFSRSLLDSKPLERLVMRHMSFDHLHRNISSGLVCAAMVSAFNIGTSRTTIFCEKNPNIAARPTHDPLIVEHLVPLQPEHVLASSAMPFVFSAQKIDSQYFCDGGVRFNTPISPAIRAGADKLVVISLTYERQERDPESRLQTYPSVPFLAGRLLNALLLDPFEYDLEVLGRFNRLAEVLKETLPAAELERVHNVMRETRGAPYRQLDKLVFSPSEDLGRMANEHLREHLASYKVGPMARYFLKKAAQAGATWEADWATYLLFDGGYATKLIELGLRDGYAQEKEIRAFFGRGRTGPGCSVS
ncbi:MAG TPA: patatin-like phospholipase family protein [Polyangiaceae bacterium]|jgi:NTE family protein|nr:patatin-like phospholipase family protein [Polyangiaceae bacterium]